MILDFQAGTDFSAAKSRELVLGLLEHTPAPLSRSQFAPGHITCTGMVLHPFRHAFLLIHHQKLDRWLLPGGHVEDVDDEPWLAAKREVEEETSAILTGEPGRLVGIDVHGIPPRKQEPFHQHHDLIFAFRAASEELVPTEEIHAAIWYDLADISLDAYQIPQNTKLCARRAVTQAYSLG